MKNLYISKIILAGFILTPWTQVNAINNQYYKYGLIATGVSTIAASAWGFFERYKKNKIKIDFDRLSNDENKLKSSEQLLGSIETFVAKIKNEYAQEINTISGNSIDVEQMVNCFKDSIPGKQDDFDYCIRYLNEQMQQDINQALKYKNEIELKMIEWDNDLRVQHISKAKIALNLLSSAIDYLQKIYSIFCSEKEYIKLSLIVRKYAYKYKEEIKLNNSTASQDEFYWALDTRIKSTFSQAEFQFPYLSYVEKIKKDLVKLQNSLSGLPDSRPLQFQEETITKAKQIYTSLSYISEFLVTKDEYQQEKDRKPEYDKQEAMFQQQLKEKQQKLDIEMREKQARIDRENKIAQAKLLDEQNRAQQLANQEAEIGRQRKQLEVREREISLELIRIQGGQLVNDAVKNNDKEWQKKLDKEKSDYAKKLNKLKNDLQGAVKNLPCNPDSVDGLQGYVNKLQYLISQIQSI